MYIIYHNELPIFQIFVVHRLGVCFENYVTSFRLHYVPKTTDRKNSREQIGYMYICDDSGISRLENKFSGTFLATYLFALCSEDYQ